jgi:hypothetical protein
MFHYLNLEEWWQLLSGAGQFYWAVALIASVFFVILFGLSLLGLATDTDADVGHDVSHDFSIDKDFSAFSIRSIVAFLTFFGWTGVYFLSQGTSVLLASVFAGVAGFAAMFLVAYMIFKFAQMEKSGTVQLMNAIEKTGEVYLTIPSSEKGTGKVHVIVDGSMHEFDAATKGDVLKTGSAVKVVDVLENDVLLVEQILLETQQDHH